MSDFDSVMKLTATVGSPVLLEPDECALFYRTLTQLEAGSSILEIGVSYGRSTSLILQEAKTQGHDVDLVDPFLDEPDSLRRFIQMAGNTDANFSLHKMTAERWFASGRSLNIYDFIHIDGSHVYADVAADCKRLDYLTASGAFVLFHDYGRESLPDVKKAIDEKIGEVWERVDLVGTLLVVRRK